MLSILGGTWTHAVNSNANIVPTVAKGKVYVASNLELRIYGLTNQQASQKVEAASLTPSKADTVSCPAEIPATAVVGSAAGVHQLYGTVCQTSGTQMRLSLRSGRAVSVDVSSMSQSRKHVLLTPGRPLHVSVTIDKAGIAHAQKIAPSHALSPETPADR